MAHLHQEGVMGKSGAELCQAEKWAELVGSG